MLFTITAKHMEITDSIRSHAQERVEKLPRYYNSITHIEVIVDGSPNISVEVIARAEHSNVFIATETGDDFYTCLDLAVHKVERQLSRKKEKQRNNKHITGVGEIEVEMTGTD